MKIEPKKIAGNWDQGYSLDSHTVSSKMTGYNAYGHPEYETKRTPMGDLVYRLKYRQDADCIQAIVSTVAEFLKDWNISPDILVSVPPTKPRKWQPVVELAKEISKAAKIPYLEKGVRKVKSTTQLKDGIEYAEKMQELENAFEICRDEIVGRRVLVFDDLYDSGATMDTIAAELKKCGARRVYVLTLTKTRG